MTNLDSETVAFAMGLFGLIGILFAVYNSFRNPQFKFEKIDALLSQQVQWEKETTAKRFEEIAKVIADTTALAQNHIHTVDTKVDALIQSTSELRSHITKLETIIEERIPRPIR